MRFRHGGHREAIADIPNEAFVSTGDNPGRGHGMSVQLAIRDATTERKGGMAKVVFAGSVGTIIEWYDFLIYGTAAALVVDFH